MFKVSFKGTPEEPAKTVCRFNNKITIVRLCGTLVLNPNITFKSVIPWLANHPFMKNSRWDRVDLNVTGIAKRADGDVDNPILAERIAEARAKIKIYKFMARLLKKVCKEYYKTLYGNTNSMPTMGWGGLFGDMTKYDNLLFKEEEHLNQLLKKARA